MADKDSHSRRKERKARQQDQEKKAKSWIREWTDALLFAAIAAIIIRTFFFQAYRIPTPSMENTLLVGDFLVVSKISYGPRTPMVLGIPFTTIYLPGVTLPWVRLPGFSEVERNDVVVFNYPIDIAPVAAKTNYIKRCVAVPGDTLSMRDSRLFVNDELAALFPGIQHHYVAVVQNRVRLSSAKVQTGGGKLISAIGENRYLVNMTKAEADSMRDWPEITDVYLYVLPKKIHEFDRAGFVFSKHFTNHDHIPPIIVPFKGQKITLTSQNWPIYKTIIERYERNSFERQGDTFIINGEKTNTYTIQQNYYFMMGDNRDNSEDSRFWGFVPYSHIIGEASFIYFSWDADRMFPRFGRILNIIE